MLGFLIVWFLGTRGFDILVLLAWFWEASKREPSPWIHPGRSIIWQARYIKMSHRKYVATEWNHMLIGTFGGPLSRGPLTKEIWHRFKWINIYYILYIMLINRGPLIGGPLKVLWYRCLWRKHSFYARLSPAIQRQKLLSTPRLGAPKACLPRGLLLQRSVFSQTPVWEDIRR